MNSPLARVILSFFGGCLIILLFLSIYDWIVEEYPRRPAKPLNSGRIQHPFYHEEVVKALQRFSRLPRPVKAAIKNNLRSNLISMKQWLAHLGESHYQIVCMGELHEESTRNFLAEEFFTKFDTDVLLLEATPKKLKRLIERRNDGRDYFPLLNADIMKILRAVEVRNPDIKIWGIEETEKQQKGPNSRDQSIARNFWDRFQPGRLHIILFGALHCTNEPNWLFKNLFNQASLSLREHMLNLQVLGEHQNGSVEAFVYFLDEIGIEKKTFVIPSTNSLHPRIYELFQMLTQQTLKKYRSLVVFRM
ncbi:MAG: hypothetical protein PVG35_01765 [Desulfobacterales bacterium]|jgi:hypothetical protein